MQLHVVNCQQCGAPMNVRGSDDSVQCSRCSSVHLIERPTPMQIIAVINADPEKLHQASKAGEFLPAKATERDARIAFLHWLIHDDFTPDDILDRMQLKRFTCQYCPFYLFTVDWSAGWSAEVGYSYEVNYTDYETRYGADGKSYKEPVNKKRTEIRWMPSSGQVGGREEFAVTAMRRPPSRVYYIERCCTSLWHGNQLDELMVAPSPGVELCKADMTERMAYNERVIHDINRTASTAVDQAIPGEQTQNIRWSLTRQDHAARRVFIPLWNASYMYGGIEYSCSASAWRSQPTVITGATPDDAQKRAAVDAYYAKYRQLKVKYIIAFIALLLAGASLFGLSWFNYGTDQSLSTVGYLVSGVLAVIAAVVAFTGYRQVTSEKATADANRERHLEISRQVRRQSLARHLARL
jgi:DNA-directed RNA polymerase subunit RPC12/RpoP